MGERFLSTKTPANRRRKSPHFPKRTQQNIPSFNSLSQRSAKLSATHWQPLRRISTTQAAPISGACCRPDAPSASLARKTCSVCCVGDQWLSRTLHQNILKQNCCAQ